MQQVTSLCLKEKIAVHTARWDVNLAVTEWQHTVIINVGIKMLSEACKLIPLEFVGWVQSAFVHSTSTSVWAYWQPPSMLFAVSPFISTAMWMTSPTVSVVPTLSGKLGWHWRGNLCIPTVWVLVTWSNPRISGTYTSAEWVVERKVRNCDLLVTVCQAVLMYYRF